MEEIITIQEPVEVVVISDGIADEVVVINQEVIEVVEVVEQGMAGADGVGTTTITKTAVSALGGHRVVRSVNETEVGYADSGTNAHRNLILGVTTGAASIGADVEIKTFGEMSEPSWNWTTGNLIFCGENGLLTETVPPTGFVCVIGAATSETTIFIRIRQPIELGA
ncbi:MAG TPA: hypothetical protein VGD05_07610 [Pyrinomonadaceae bacterium]|jgi:hypothetical protein